MPEYVQRLLRRLSPGQLDFEFMPQTVEIDRILEHSFAHEFLAPYHRLSISEENKSSALDLVNSAIQIHRTSLYNSRGGEDESSWYPVVRRLLSVVDDSSIPSLPADLYPGGYDFLQTIDATTKLTTSTLPPVINTKLDCLIVFNDDALILHAWQSNIRTNVFADTTRDGKVIALGIEVTSPVAGGQTKAEYQVAVWGMKTLNLPKLLAGDEKWDPAIPCHIAVGLSVCGHVWSMHVTYWRSDGAIVTHGPVCVGSTDSLSGTMKIIKWVFLFKKWAGEGGGVGHVEAARAGGGFVGVRGVVVSVLCHVLLIRRRMY